MKKTVFATTVFCLFLSLEGVYCQIDLNFELQAYPTGIIPGVRIEQNQGTKSATHLRLGYNWIRHRDLGVHDDERGDGFGFTIGHKRYFNENHEGWNIGLKSDVWWMRIHLSSVHVWETCDAAVLEKARMFCAFSCFAAVWRVFGVGKSPPQPPLWQ